MSREVQAARPPTTPSDPGWYPTIRMLVKQGRPKQWAKNVLVFAAPAAAHELNNTGVVADSVLLFIAFCLVSSGTYYWNDLFDLEVDRLHPVKRHRPIASGAISILAARWTGTGLILAGLAVAAFAQWQCVLVAVGYVVLTLTYSIVWKHIAVVDLVVVAAGFVVRAIAGAFVADVPLSNWFLLFTSFAAMFIVTGKRYAELREYGEDAARTRVTLEAYSLAYLRTILSVSLAASMITYCLWAFNAAEIYGTTLPFYELSIVPMTCALLRYTLVIEQGHGAAPEEVFIADRTLQVIGCVWMLCIGLAIYG